MQKSMLRDRKIIFLLAILVIVVIGTTILASFAFITPFHPFSPLPPPTSAHGGPPFAQGIPGDLQLFYGVEAVVSSVNITLLVFLLITNADIFRKTRSKFTFILLIFAAAFLFNNVTSSPLVIWAFGFHQIGLGPFAFIPDLFELMVLCALVYLSYE
jgi:hypothetical protein